MGEKHQWTNDQIKCLLESCIEEVNTLGRKGLSLHKDSWNKVGRVLKQNFGVDLTQKQMKNSYDNLKAKYTGWIYLKNKTSNLYNPQTNTFNLTTEEWDEFKKVYIYIYFLNIHVYLANIIILIVTLGLGTSEGRIIENYTTVVS